MLHGIISTVTTLAVVFHSLVGCCAHHAHPLVAVEGGAADVVVELHVGSTSECGCEHGKSPDRANDHDSGQGDDGKPCDEPGCSFLSDGRFGDPDSILLSTIWLAAATDVNAGIVGLEPAFAATQPPDRSLRPRLHCALCQVWRL